MEEKNPIRVGDLDKGETFRWAKPHPDEDPNEVLLVVQPGSGVDERGEYESATTDVAWVSDLRNPFPARLTTSSNDLVIRLGPLDPSEEDKD